MKIDEKRFYCLIQKASGKILDYGNNTRMVRKHGDLFSHQFSPCGRAGGTHLLRYSWLAITGYGCALKCLAYGSLQLVQNSGNNNLQDCNQNLPA